MQIKEAIILAGGLGTRLRSAVPDLPKCMAPVAGRPFISYVIGYFREQGISKFIFSLGYKSEIILDYLRQEHEDLNFDAVVEEEPLGTGGAIRLACTKASDQHILVLNGDTIFRIDPSKLAKLHESAKADCTLSLKPMQDFDRYGLVEINADHSIKEFREKQYYTHGLINGGVYALNAEAFLRERLPEKFSFEKDYLEKLFRERPMYALVQDEYFIDIGIPQDYEKAQEDFIHFK
jgi:D-glycero-alpha-D-manno-heptose 1-phosphate guanylyltransferase